VTDWVVDDHRGRARDRRGSRRVPHACSTRSGNGSIAPQVMLSVWWLLRLFPSDRRITSLTGPLGIGLVVVITWGAIAVLALGNAVLRLDAGGLRLQLGAEQRPRASSEFDSLYISLVTIGTLGFGDIVPTLPVLRLLVAARVAVRLHAADGSGVVGSADLPSAAPPTRSGATAFDASRGPSSRPHPGHRQHSQRRPHWHRQRRRGSAQRHSPRYGATYYFRDVEADASLAASLCVRHRTRHRGMRQPGRPDPPRGRDDHLGRRQPGQALERGVPAVRR
jgi:hypothetical protein